MIRSHRSRSAGRSAAAAALSIAVLAVAGGSATLAQDASGSPAAPATSPEWDAIVEAAKTEGLATALVTEVPGWVDQQQRLFTDTTGLGMALLARGPNGVLETRLTSEIEANALQTDVFEDVSRAFFLDHEDWFMDLSTAGLPNWDAYPENAKWNDRCADVKWSVSGVTYNTDLVSEADVPNTWQDLVDPKWTDQVILSDPTPGGYYMQWALMMRDAFGPEYLQAVAALNPELQASSVAAAQQVASGAKALSFLSQVDSGADVAKLGAPIAFKVLSDPGVGSQACVGILKNAPHPNAAKVLLNFLMSPESQSAPCQAGIPNVSPIGAEGCYQTPEGWTPPQLTEGGFYPGMDDDALKAQALQELGLGS